MSPSSGADSQTVEPKAAAHAGWLRTMLRYPSAVLLLVQLGGVLLYPWMDTAAAGRTLFGVFGVIVLGLAVRMVKRSPGLNSIAYVLAGMAVLSLTAQSLWPHPHLILWTVTLEAAFYFYAAGCLILYMLEDDHPTTDELFASGATFTLLAWAFAYLYTLCQLLSPGSFVADPSAQAARSWMDLLFLSFTCLSGVGLGDIVPLTPMARALVMLQEFVGVMYMALVVSRLIGLTTQRRRLRSEK